MRTMVVVLLASLAWAGALAGTALAEDVTPPPAPEILMPSACAVVEPSPFSPRGMPLVQYTILPDPETGTPGHEIAIDGEVIRTLGEGELPGGTIPLGVHTLSVTAINGAGLRTSSEVLFRLGPGEPPCEAPSDPGPEDPPPTDPGGTDTTPPPAPTVTEPRACEVVAPSPFSGRGMPVVAHEWDADPESGTPKFEIELDGQVVRTHPGGEVPGPSIPPGVHTLRVIAINGAGLRTASVPVVFGLGSGATPCASGPGGPADDADPADTAPPAGDDTPPPAGDAPPATTQEPPPATASETPPTASQTTPPTVRVARRAGFVQLRVVVDGKSVILRRRVRRDGTVLLPAALADASAIRWRPWRPAGWRSTKRIRTQDARRRNGRAYLVRVGAAPKTKVQVRVRRGRKTVVLTRRVLSGRRVRVPGRARAARWRLAQSAWRAPVKVAATS